MRVSLQPGFVLHQRAFRETSLLLDVLTKEYGRISLVARGIRKNKSRLKPLLQPFTPLFISWQGKSELKGLTEAEGQGLAFPLKGRALLSGFYLNELVIRLLPKHDPHPELYTIYQHTLLELANLALLPKTLRLFEKKMLDILGYGAFNCVFKEDKFYHFDPELGFKECSIEGTENSISIFNGKSLKSIAEEKLEGSDILRDAKRLMRIAIMSLLGSQSLHSRKLFIEVFNEK